MAAHLSIATALDKNRIASNVVYLMLLEVDITDPDGGQVIETVYAAMNNEPWDFQGHTYEAIPFEVQLTQEKETAPVAQLVVYDLGQIFQAALQAYGRGISWPTRFKVINIENPTPCVEIEQDFMITAATARADEFAITFTLSAENPLTLRFPPRQQFRDRCYWIYKGPQCGYAGDLPTCSYMKDDANGCKAHNNLVNFGGFPGLGRGQTIT